MKRSLRNFLFVCLLGLVPVYFGGVWLGREVNLGLAKSGVNQVQIKNFGPVDGCYWKAPEFQTDIKAGETVNMLRAGGNLWDIQVAPADNPDCDNSKAKPCRVIQAKWEEVCQ